MVLSNLSIVIPVYNEQARISASLDTILEYISNSDFYCEILIGDDGSRDNTVDVVNAYVEKYSNIHLFEYSHRGKGAVVKDTVMVANTEYCFICDADLSMPIEQLDRFILDLDKNDHILYGSRENVSSNRIGEPYFRYLLGRVFNFLAKLLLQINIKDTQCGFKMFNMEVCRDIFEKQTMNGFVFDAELFFLAKIKQLNTKEIPIDWYYYGNSKVRPTVDSAKMFIDIIRIRLNSLFGHYK